MYPAIKYTGGEVIVANIHDYQMKLALHATHFDGLAKQIIKDDHYEINLGYHKHVVRALGYLANDTSITQEQFLDVVKIVDGIIRYAGEEGSEIQPAFEKSTIREFYELMIDVYVALDARQPKGTSTY